MGWARRGEAGRGTWRARGRWWDPDTQSPLPRGGYSLPPDPPALSHLQAPAGVPTWVRPGPSYPSSFSAGTDACLRSLYSGGSCEEPLRSGRQEGQRWPRGPVRSGGRESAKKILGAVTKHLLAPNDRRDSAEGIQSGARIQLRLDCQERLRCTSTSPRASPPRRLQLRPNAARPALSENETHN